MTVSSLWSLAINCHSEFVQTLLEPGKSSRNSVKIGIIHTKVSFQTTNTDLTFTCSDRDTLLTCEKITNGKTQLHTIFFVFAFWIVFMDAC